jgi:hypothetical protein
MGIRYVSLWSSLPISTVARSRFYYSPRSFAPALPTFPIPPRAKPDWTTNCACSLQRPAASQPCASASHWTMKRGDPPRSITIPRIIKVMPWSVMSFFYHLLPTGLERRKDELTHLVGPTQDITVDEKDDPNFDPTVPVLEDESPYPEVCSAVANTDDPTMPSSTFRAWVVGLIWAVLLPGVNQFFFFRYPAVSINQVRETFSHGISVSLLGS